jgi:hypothetical protein
MNGFSVAWQTVICADCGDTFQCTPSSDYYHRPDVPEDERTLENGVCEPCLLGYRGRKDVRLTRPQG